MAMHSAPAMAYNEWVNQMTDANVQSEEHTEFDYISNNGW